MSQGPGFLEILMRYTIMIYIVRHGQTEKNKNKVLQGRSDVPLNDTGRQQASALKAYFDAAGIHVDCVWSSPLLRAVQTARILAPDRTPEVDDRLIEMDYGPYEGADLTNLPHEVLEFFHDFVHNPAPEGMETLENVVKRAGEFVEEKCRKEGNILISTHAIAMKAILEYLSPESKGGYWTTYIGNCGVYVTEYKDGTFTVPVLWKTQRDG